MSELTDKNPEKIQRMFDEISPRYDLLNHLLSLGIDIHWRRKTVRTVLDLIADQKEKFPLLDVATGTGDLAFELVRRMQQRKWFTPETETPRVYGVDFSPQMLKRAREKATRFDPTGSILFDEADGTHLPFDSNTFSAATIAFGIRNMSDTDQAVRELTRVCRPGGWVAILEFTMPTFPLFAIPYRLYFKYVLPIIGAIVSRKKNRAYEYLPQSVAGFDNRATMTQRMIDAGLSDVAARSMTFGTVTLYLGKKKEATDSLNG